MSDKIEIGLSAIDARGTVELTLTDGERSELCAELNKADAEAITRHLTEQFKLNPIVIT